jgi:hypothetical protein
MHEMNLKMSLIAAACSQVYDIVGNSFGNVVDVVVILDELTHLTNAVVNPNALAPLGPVKWLIPCQIIHKELDNSIEKPHKDHKLCSLGLYQEATPWFHSHLNVSYYGSHTVGVVK